mmetsp:Transcript_115200/g.172171  ORF Transcript_115200/g.172171 Transcript_115200/m.172171 type:complete len:321 (+) Transcript_115200:131-1093(+)
MLSGSVPPYRFCSRSKCSKAVNLPMSDGSGPSNSPAWSRDSCLRVPAFRSDHGNCPDNSFSPKSIASNLVKRPNSVGIEPRSVVSLKLNACKFESRRMFVESTELSKLHFSILRRIRLVGNRKSGEILKFPALAALRISSPCIFITISSMPPFVPPSSRIFPSKYNSRRLERFENSAGIVNLNALLFRRNTSRLDNRPISPGMMASNELSDTSNETKLVSWEILRNVSIAFRPAREPTIELDVTLKCRRLVSALISSGMDPIRLLSSRLREIISPSLSQYTPACMICGSVSLSRADSDQSHSCPEERKPSLSGQSFPPAA